MSKASCMRLKKNEAEELTSKRKVYSRPREVTCHQGTDVVMVARKQGQSCESPTFSILWSLPKTKKVAVHVKDSAKKIPDPRELLGSMINNIWYPSRSKCHDFLARCLVGDAPYCT